MKKNTLQAIMFDFDGVIIDSTDTKSQGFRALFSDYDPEKIEEIVAFHRKHGGISRVEKIRYAHRQILGVALTEDKVAEWSARYSELVEDKVVVVDWIAGAQEFLEEMAGKTLLFVISGTPEEELKRVLERRGMAGYFVKALGSPTKKPDHIRKLLRDFQLDQEKCVFIGDALTDYNAALETQVPFVGIRSEVDYPAGTTVLPDCQGLMDVLAGHFVW